MKIDNMITTTSKAAFGISFVGLLAAGATLAVLAGQAACDDLSPAEILKNVQEEYSSLASYSDEGYVVTDLHGDPILGFTTRLARPNYYRIEWNQSSEPSSFASNAEPQAVWCSGAIDLLVEGGCRVQKGFNRHAALARVAGPSRGASATLARMFFDRQCGNQEEQLDELMLGGTRQPDENLGNISCYVLATECQGRTNTLWIGKQDYLIHQVRIAISTEAIQAAAVNVLGLGPEIVPALRGFTSTETHTNIVLNQQFSRSDFVPSFPLLGYSDNE